MIFGRHSLGFHCHWRHFLKHRMLEIERILEVKNYVNQTPHFTEKEILTQREL